MDNSSSIEFIRNYELQIVKTDRFSNDEITPILMGFYGEIGSIMATSKKYYREKCAYAGHKEAVEEEFGDAFWYFSALCRRLEISVENIIRETCGNLERVMPAASQKKSKVSDELDLALIQLGCSASKLLADKDDKLRLRQELTQAAHLYCSALRLTGLDFSKIIDGNLSKALGRFSMPSIDDLEDFDFQFPKYEQLPREFSIKICERKSGFSYLQWNGVYIGDPLTDNIRKPDGYRFHDVFHMANAAVLHWSPTFRALIKHKRKSDPATDKEQDGGRAIVVEEGLTAWLFSYAQGVDNFNGHDGVSFDVLKTIQKFIQGYEVERCPLKLWENAILQGYSVFREMKKNGGGIVVGNRDKRTISYLPLGEDNESQ